MHNSNLSPARFEIRGLLLLTMILACFCWVGLSHAQTTVVWSEDFEGNWTDNWFADGAVWEAGAPTSGPSKAYRGTKCAGTVLAGNYPGTADARLTRHTSFTVPDASENPRLCFWQWFSFYINDYGVVQIKVGSQAWKNLSETLYWYGSNVWSYASIDLTPFSGQTVQIGFFMQAREDGYSSNGNDTNPGWYIDDVALITGPIKLNNPENFESGWNDWHAENGTWEIGKPTAGPTTAHASTNCAGTALKGNYSGTADSRLISPKFTVPAASENPRFCFWQWYSFYINDWGVIQIKVGNQAWKNIADAFYWYGSGVWSYTIIDLSQYAGQSVQIGFYFQSREDGYSSNGDDTSTGWYIDDVALVTGPIVYRNPDDFESGWGDWHAEYGTWEIGKPTSGPGAAHSLVNCAGTVLAGEYWGTVDSRLISRKFKMSKTGSNLAVQFWQWYSFSINDYGQVQIKVNDKSWKSISPQFTSNSGTWSPYYISLASYADSTVQIGFFFQAREDGYSSNGADVSTGWYIDDFEVRGAVPPDDTPPVDDRSPLLSSLTAMPNPTGGSDTLKLTAYLSDELFGNSKITYVEYFIDNKGTAGNGHAMSAVDGVFDSSTESVTAMLQPNVLWPMNSTHKLYVHGKDEYNNWSNLDSVTVEITPAPDDKHIAIRDTTASRGTAVTIPLRFDNWEKIAGAEIKLTFDAAILKAKSVTLSAALSGFTKRDTLTDGKAVIALARATGLAAGSGVFLSIDFDVLPTATPGATTEIAFTTARFWDENTNLLTVITDNGVFTVKQDTVIQVLASILVSPSSDTLVINGTMSLAATGKDTEGKEMAVTPRWSVTSLFGNIGSIASTPNASVTFTASGPGDGLITASQEGKAGSAVVVVGKTKGDINLDGGDIVNTQDAILGLQIIAKLLTPHLYQLWAADYDGSGTVLENDIQKILYDAVKAMLPKSTFSTRAALVSLGAIEKREDGLISIPVLVCGRGDLGAGGLEISYDVNKLAAVVVTPGQASTLLMSNLSENGLIRVSSVDMDGLIDGRSVWMKLVFRPKESLEEIPALTFTNIRLFDGAAEPVGVELGNFEVLTAALPEHFQLHQNFPNPFNPATTIRFDLAAPAHVDLSVYNTTGQKVRSLVNRSLEAGVHTARWEGNDESGNPMPAGLYLCRIIIDHGAYTKINKMIFVK